jgi:hypothetical protein
LPQLTNSFAWDTPSQLLKWFESIVVFLASLVQTAFAFPPDNKIQTFLHQPMGGGTQPSGKLTAFNAKRQENMSGRLGDSVDVIG